jgi:CheY-like chemotaxis protein
MSQKHILVIDDDETIRLMLREMLEGAGYRVSLAEEGQSALSSAWTDRPDLIITDIDMPVIDGKRTVAMFERDETVSSVPVIVVSGTVGLSDVPGLLEATHALAFFAKPVDRKELLSKVREILAAS